MSFVDTDFPADPYPGARPDCSYAHVHEIGFPLLADRSSISGLRLADSGEDVDEWLASHGAAPLAERVPVLAYGSNACPAKITWLREKLGLPGPVIALRARCVDLSAVWSAGYRTHDDQRPATLAAATGVHESHFVWFVAADQLPALDACEGRGERYALAWLRSGSVWLDGDVLLDEVLGYVAASDMRQPLLVDGAMVRCSQRGQLEARALRGVPAGSHGLDVSVQDGQPDPLRWPARVFVYGTLQPGSEAWPLIEPYLAGRPRRATMTGTLFDTGLGYPALRPAAEAGHTVPGWVLPLADPPAALAVLDDYEGPEYRRLRLPTTGGELCWTYLFCETVDGMPALPEGWPSPHLLG
ncbi:MAG: gamma-glutamylcyclotransferase [Pseudonocardiaceae bacterium]|nr:gamma-glutamylcyclotransferase [Pseudonocardiaceae bacterium]